MKSRLAQRLILISVLLAGGCSGIQSALNPAGREGERLASLFWWMTGGTLFIWVAMIALAFYVVRARPESFTRRRERLLIVGGGALVPTVVLGVLLVYGLAMLPDLMTSAPPGSLKITVLGERWWWRVRYELPGGQQVELANEIRLPVGEAVQFQLESPDVVHSFWIPSIGGKMDMIPGRLTFLALTPTRLGLYRGACAEYCGTSHALMNFYTEVMEREPFTAWLAQQTRPAQPPTQPLGARGRELFFATGCNACHAIRGTTAKGVIGPDLTHVGSRLSLAAGILPNEVADFRRWIAHTEQVKPGVLMPSFGMLPEAELRALAAYLEGLK